MEVFGGIKLDRELKKHLYVQLFEEIEKLIKQDTLKEHDKLPPIRTLADFLDVNNVTVVNAYKILEEKGYVYKKVGSGTYVSPVNHIEDMDGENDYLDDSIKYNFAITSPAANLFPVDDFKEALNMVLDRDRGLAFGYHESKGYKPLRESIVQYLTYQNIKTTMDDIQIISGAQQGLDLVAKAILNYGDYVIVETPTYTGAIATFKSRGVNIIEVPIDSDGINLEAFENAVEKYKPKLVYTMPNFQNPTGYTYAEYKKNQMIELSEKWGYYIIEDDYSSELNFTSDLTVSLKSLDDYDNVIYIKSFSKVFMPGLRLGFMVVPEMLNNDIMLAKHTTDISTSGLTQRAFDQYLRSGDWKQQINRVKGIFKRRYLITCEALDRHLPGSVVYDKPLGGLNFWIQLPKNIDSEKFADLVSEEGISVVSGAVFKSVSTKSNCFRLSIASIAEEAIEPGIVELSKCIENYLKEIEKKRKMKKMPII